MAEGFPFDLLEKILARLDVKNLLRYKSVCKSWYSLISSFRFLMAGVVPFDLLEKILAQLDVKNLLRCKSVCKSWYSFISSSHFVKAHLNRTCNKVHEIRHRKIAIRDASFKSLKRLFLKTRHYIVGSSNGLLCIYLCENNELEVANPSTREVKELQKLTEIPKNAILCCGFGYDLSTDDYKVIVGFKKLKMTKFYLLTLRSNSWEFIKDANYEFIENSNPGILYHGTINWLMKDQNKKKVILSFDLTKEEFKEIPLPYNSQKSECYDVNRLGVSDYDECMLIYKYRSYQTYRYKWVMENDTVKEFWKLEQDDNEMARFNTSYVKELMYNPQESCYVLNKYVMSMNSLWDYKCAPMFVESLVSPHRRKRIQAKEGDQSVKTTESGSQKRRRTDLQSIQIEPPQPVNHSLLHSMVNEVLSPGPSARV